MRNDFFSVKNTTRPERVFLYSHFLIRQMAEKISESKSVRSEYFVCVDVNHETNMNEGGL